jgi:hypothetical protein
MWTLSDISVDFDDLTVGRIVTVRIDTPAGLLMFMGEIEIVGRRLIARECHIHAERGGLHAFGWARLRQVARLLLELLETYDELVVEGGIRTSGANPGRRPRPLRFTRTLPD